VTVVLVGFRGAGKTTVGRLAAARLGVPFFDSDAEIAAEAGRSIAEIFAVEGEAAFRDREERALARLLSSSEARSVVAAGGGAVLRAPNRERMKAAGLVFWLEASVETLRGRIAADPTTPSQRPPLSPGGAGGGANAAEDEVESILRAREPYYLRTADERVAVDGRTPEAIADEIVLVVRARGEWKGRRN